MQKAYRWMVGGAATAAFFAVSSLASASGFDVTSLTTSTQSTWETAIVAILSVVGIFLGAKVAIKWAMHLLAR
jgi:hypothetical protein